MKVMLHKIGILCGILAPVLWASAIAVSGSLRPEYSHLRQYISDLGERDGSTELIMRAWVVEVERRIAEIEAGRAQVVPAAETIARARDALK